MRTLRRSLLILSMCVGLVLAGPPLAVAQQPDFNERFGTDRPVELSPGTTPPSREAIPPSTDAKTIADVMRDPAQLPPPVSAMRDRLLEAARTGELAEVQRLVTENRVVVKLDEQPVDSVVLLWRSQYPDTAGLEALSILISTLEAGFVRVDAGTPNEMYVWPYFAQVPLQALGNRELVELLRIVTAYDHQLMLDAGAWTFFRLGIAPDGTWHYFLAGE